MPAKESTSQEQFPVGKRIARGDITILVDVVDGQRRLCRITHGARQWTQSLMVDEINKWDTGTGTLPIHTTAPEGEKVEPADPDRVKHLHDYIITLESRNSELATKVSELEAAAVQMTLASGELKLNQVKAELKDTKKKLAQLETDNAEIRQGQRTIESTELKSALAEVARLRDLVYDKPAVTPERNIMTKTLIQRMATADDIVIGDRELQEHLNDGWVVVSERWTGMQRYCRLEATAKAPVSETPPQEITVAVSKQTIDTPEPDAAQPAARALTPTLEKITAKTPIMRAIAEYGVETVEAAMNDMAQKAIDNHPTVQAFRNRPAFGQRSAS